MTIDKLNEVAKSLIDVKAMIEELEAEAESLTDTIKAFMVEEGKENISGDGWKASWKNVNTSRFDGKAFKAEHADLYAAYSKHTTTTRFIITK